MLFCSREGSPLAFMAVIGAAITAVVVVLRVAGLTALFPVFVGVIPAEKPFVFGNRSADWAILLFPVVTGFTLSVGAPLTCVH